MTKERTEHSREIYPTRRQMDGKLSLSLSLALSLTPKTRFVSLTIS